MFRRFFTPFSRFCALGACLWACGAATLRAQELRVQPVPFSVWLDIEALSRPDPPHVALPIWLESLQVQHTPADAGTLETTVYRLRLRRMEQLNRELQLRLFFDDRAGASPVVTGWTETGRQTYQSDPLGSGLELPTSASLTVPVAGADYLDVTVPGDGTNLRGIFLNTLTKTEGSAPLDFPPSPEVPDAFGNLPAAQPQADDMALFGRVRATLQAKAVKLAPDETLEFELERPPLMAMVTFEVLNVDIAYPPEITINGQSLGAARLRLPDLADPAYRGDVRPLESDMRFRYTGWLPCQMVIPGSLLRAGLNRLSLVVNKQGGSVAVRAVELQLKNNWRNLDYTLSP